MHWRHAAGHRRILRELWFVRTLSHARFSRQGSDACQVAWTYLHLAGPLSGTPPGASSIPRPLLLMRVSAYPDGGALRGFSAQTFGE